MRVKSLSLVRLLATPWTAAHQAPPSMGFSSQEYWSGVPLPSPKKHILCWPLTFASVSLQNEFLASSVYTVTGWLILGPMKKSPERKSDWLTLADTTPSLINNHGDRVPWSKHGFLSI